MDDAMARPAPTREDAAPSPRDRGRTGDADDLYTWVQERVARPRAGDLDALDLDDIAEEPSDVGSEQSDTPEGALEVSLAHALEWDHQPERRSRGGSLPIAGQRVRLASQLRENPGRKSRIAEAGSESFPVGQLRAARAMTRSPKTLPADCPSIWDEIQNRPFEFEADR